MSIRKYMLHPYISSNSYVTWFTCTLNRITVKIVYTNWCSVLCSTGPYYLAQNMLPCKENAAALDGLFSTYYVFNKILFGNVSPGLTWTRYGQDPDVLDLKYIILLFTRSNSQNTTQNQTNHMVEFFMRIEAVFMLNSNRHLIYVAQSWYWILQMWRGISVGSKVLPYIFYDWKV